MGHPMNPLSKPFQRATCTLVDRYPHLWRRAVAILKKSRQRILCFGCSTGEECQTALAHFPEAFVVGVEVKAVPRRIAAMNSHGGRTLIISPDELPSFGNFSLVCACSVLCNHPENADKPTNSRMTFAAFDAAVTRLADLVAPGGVLMIANAEYQFRDTKASAAFAADLITDDQQVTIFDAAGAKLETRRSNPLWIRRDHGHIHAGASAACAAAPGGTA